MAQTSEEERREVAERVRKTHGIMAFVDALGIDVDSDWCWTDVSRRVAGLIDPTCHAEQDYDRDEPIQGRWWKCEKCGEHFIYERGFEPSFCPDCGARVVSGDAN